MGLVTEVVGQYNITRMSDGKYAVSVNNGNMGAFITDEKGVQKIKEKYNALSQYEKDRLEQQRLFHNPLERSPQGDVVRFTSKPQNVAPPEEPKKSKKGWLAVLAGAVLTVGAIILTKGKAAKKAIPEDLKIIFKELKGKKGKEFVDAAYEKMVEHMGLKGIAPKGIGRSGGDKLAINGGYNPLKNTIEYSDGFFNKLSQKQQINFLSHELKHCQQFTNMLRTEGITVEQYAKALAESSVKNALKGNSDDFGTIMFRGAYNDAVAAGKGEEFIENAIKHQVEKLVPEIEENFAEVLKMPKIPANSPEGQKALEHLEAFRNYEGLNMFGLGSDAYRNNPLEVEAYGFGQKLAKMFRDFNIFSRLGFIRT